MYNFSTGKFVFDPEHRYTRYPDLAGTPRFGHEGACPITSTWEQMALTDVDCYLCRGVPTSCSSPSSGSGWPAYNLVSSAIFPLHHESRRMQHSILRHTVLFGPHTTFILV
jgi:hypothetical protein